MKKLFFIFFLFSPLSHAKAMEYTRDISGVYLGGGFGSTDFDDDGASAGYTKTKDISLKLITGYRFNRIAAIEMQYTKYGDVFLHPSKLKVGLSSASIAANIGYTFDNGLRPFGIAGVGLVDGELKGMGYSDDATSFHYGLGVDYAPERLGGVALRLAYEADAFDVESEKIGNDDYKMKVGTMYFGVTYRF